MAVINRNIERNITVMFRKITEVWPDLVRAISGDQANSLDASDDRGQEGSDSGRSQDFDAEQVLIDYKNLSWTWLMTIEDYEPGISRKFRLGPDIVEECNAVKELPDQAQPEWKPLFEPNDFN